MKRVLTVMMLVGALLTVAAASPRNIYAQEESSKKKDKKVSEEDSSKKDKKDKKSAEDDTAKKQKKMSLYVRLGGKKNIQSVVDEFITLAAADSRINKFFADTAKDSTRLKQFNKNLVDQICEATGGPCKYKGKDMKTAHQGMGITEADFTALVEDLVKALNKFNVGEAEKNELLAILAPMKGSIVEK